MRFDCSNVEEAILSLCPRLVSDAATDPFRTSVPARGFLYPASYRLTKSDFGALRSVCVENGQHGFLVHSLLRELTGELERDCVHVRWQDGHNAPHTWIRSPLEAVMIDDEATWAVVFSSDDFAVIGGSEKHVSEYFRRAGRTSAENLALYIDELRPPTDLEASLKGYLLGS